MTRKTNMAFLEAEVGLLVQHFGVERVRRALSKVSNGVSEIAESQSRTESAQREPQASRTVASTLEELRQASDERHRILADFYARLKARTVLPETQDIRHYAQIVGIKAIVGKSRMEMIPGLMDFLMRQPMGRLRVHIEKAAEISEKQREQGYSVLTDKLVGDKEGRNGTS